MRTKKPILISAVAIAALILALIFSRANKKETVYYSKENSTAVTNRIPQGKITKAVQQIMIGTETANEEQARQTLKAIKDAGYDAIELNEFMIHDSGLTVRLLTKLAGMPVGKGGKLDWSRLVQESGLAVSSLHTYLAQIEENPLTVAKEAECFGTDTVVITAMYRFDYSNLEEVGRLAERLNEAGKKLSEYGIRLLYHNHNVELQHVTAEKTAYDVIIENTNPEYVNFEFDSYWMQDGGADVASLMERLGSRIKLWHITDRGCRQKGPYTTPILKENETELGSGSMNLKAYAEIAKKNGIEGVILETHSNWIDKDPVKSIQKSAGFMRENF